MILLRQFSEHCAKLRDVIGRTWWFRKLHSDNNERHLRIAQSHLIDKGLQIGANCVDRNAVPHVVDSKLENKNIDPAVEMAGKATQAVSGGATAGAGIDHPKLGADRAQFIEQQ